MGRGALPAQMRLAVIYVATCMHTCMYIPDMFYVKCIFYSLLPITAMLLHGSHNNEAITQEALLSKTSKAQRNVHELIVIASVAAFIK